MEIIFSEINNTGVVKLNRPKALNALNLDMAKKLSEKISAWEQNNDISQILLLGEGKHFCAGGDVKALCTSKNNNKLKKEFFQVEYKLNYQISKFSKKFISLWQGVVMGGGVGLSIYGNDRLATINTKFAMPETAIGFFPDVGGSFFLSNLPNNFGKFLGLTGSIIGINELLYFGLATKYYDYGKLELVKNQITANKNIIDEKFIVEENTEYLSNVNLINQIFNGNINGIFNNLRDLNTEFGNKILSKLVSKCPMSLAVTDKLIDKAKGKSLKECLEMEFQLSQKIVYRDDFDKGINSVLIAKDHKPDWKPRNIDEINMKDLEKYFEIHTDKLYL